MKGSLIKLEGPGKEYVEYWLYCDEINNSILPIAKTVPGHNTQRLSFENCQAIENGYDLDELISESDTSHLQQFTSDSHELMYDEGFKAGFQKALELREGREFTVEQLDWAFKLGFQSKGSDCLHKYLGYRKSIHKTDFDVYIEVEDDISKCEGCLNNYPINSIGLHTYPVSEEIYGECQKGAGDKFKLDADGCLILRRI